MNEILDAIEIMVKQAVEDGTTKIYKGLCKSVTGATCTMTINGNDNTVKYYGGTPTTNTIYQVFIPFGNMSAAFIIVPGGGGGGGGAVSSVNGKTGEVVLSAGDVGALPNTTSIPTKTSNITNDSGYITAADIPTDVSAFNNDAGYITDSAVPVKSVNGKTGAVQLSADDVGALPDTTSIPSKTSDLTNNSGYITAAGAPVQSVNNKTGAVSLTATDIGLDNVDNIKQYSTSNPPPYPVTSVNGKTGDVTVTADVPDGLVKYESLSPVEAVSGIDADTLQGYDAAHFAAAADIDTINNNVAALQTKAANLESGLSTANANIANKMDKTGGTMTGALIAQANTNYTTRQVRNIIISTSDPSGGQSGDIWIRYTE